MLPLFFVPQAWQTRMACGSPVELSRRSPHAVQKTNEPIAAMMKRLISTEDAVSVSFDAL